MDASTEVKQECEENPIVGEFSIADILNSSQAQSHDVQLMRHYFLRMIKKKNHEVSPLLVRLYPHNHRMLLRRTWLNWLRKFRSGSWP